MCFSNRLACDRAVIGQMHARTLGNGVSRLRSYLVEQHTRDWMVRWTQYLSVQRKCLGPGVAAPQLSVPPAMHPVPSLMWLMAVYVRDALPRLEEAKARVTSIFGDILKMDSTKKVSFTNEHYY